MVFSLHPNRHGAQQEERRGGVVEQSCSRSVCSHHHRLFRWVAKQRELAELLEKKMNELMYLLSIHSGLRSIPLPSTHNWITTRTLPFDLVAHERDGKNRCEFGISLS